MEDIVQGLVGSVFLMSFYVLVASGLAVQFSILRVINFAHGQFYMLGSFVVFFLLKLIMGVRVDAQEEHEGLDVAEHGSPAYTE